MVRDGYIYGLSLLVVAGVLVWTTHTWAWALLPVLLAAFFLWFFRDPARQIPTGAGSDCLPWRRPGDRNNDNFDA